MAGHDYHNLGSKPAPGDLALVQAFVNSLDVESGEDHLATPEALRDWLRHHRLARGATVTEPERARAVATREALRALLLANNDHPLDPAAPDALERQAAASPLRLRFDPDGGAALEPTADGVDGALGALLAVAYRAMIEGTWSRLKACLNDTCQWAFYDASKNRSGTWCTMEVCGNRMKVRAHRQRHAHG